MYPDELFVRITSLRILFQKIKRITMSDRRNKLYELGLSLLVKPNAEKLSLLRAQVYNLKTNAGYVFQTENQIRELAVFLNGTNF